MSQNIHPVAPAEAGAEFSLREPLLDAHAAAALLSVKPSWVYDAVRNGNLPCIRVGRHIRFTTSMLEQWLGGQAAA